MSNKTFLVVEANTEVPPDADIAQVDVDVTVSSDTRAIYRLLRAIEDRQNHWSVWELVGGKARRRAVIFHEDVTIE